MNLFECSRVCILQCVQSLRLLVYTEIFNTEVLPSLCIYCGLDTLHWVLFEQRFSIQLFRSLCKENLLFTPDLHTPD